MELLRSILGDMRCNNILLEQYRSVSFTPAITHTIDIITSIVESIVQLPPLLQPTIDIGVVQTDACSM